MSKKSSRTVHLRESSVILVTGTRTFFGAVLPASNLTRRCITISPVWVGRSVHRATEEFTLLDQVFRLRLGVNAHHDGLSADLYRLLPAL